MRTYALLISIVFAAFQAQAACDKSTFAEVTFPALQLLADYQNLHSDFQKYSIEYNDAKEAYLAADDLLAKEYEAASTYDAKERVKQKTITLTRKFCVNDVIDKLEKYDGYLQQVELWALESVKIQRQLDQFVWRDCSAVSKNFFKSEAESLSGEMQSFYEMYKPGTTANPSKIAESVDLFKSFVDMQEPCESWLAEYP